MRIQVKSINQKGLVEFAQAFALQFDLSYEIDGTRYRGAQLPLERMACVRRLQPTGLVPPGTLFELNTLFGRWTSVLQAPCAATKRIGVSNTDLCISAPFTCDGIDFETFFTSRLRLQNYRDVSVCDAAGIDRHARFVPYINPHCNESMLFLVPAEQFEPNFALQLDIVQWSATTIFLQLASFFDIDIFGGPAFAEWFLQNQNNIFEMTLSTWPDKRSILEENLQIRAEFMREQQLRSQREPTEEEINAIDAALQTPCSCHGSIPCPLDIVF